MNTYKSPDWDDISVGLFIIWLLTLFMAWGIGARMGLERCTTFDAARPPRPVPGCSVKYPCRPAVRPHGKLA